MLKLIISRLHERLIFNRRVNILGERLGSLVPHGSQVVDVGTGDGQIAALVARNSPQSTVTGLDVFRRPDTRIPVTLFDGQRLPFSDKSVDVVMFADVLHHTENPAVLLHEAARVARDAVIIKDHLSESILDCATLRLMDWIGNAPHGVVLPFSYASMTQWMEWFEAAGLKVEMFDTDVSLYNFPLNVVFTRKLHFVALLQPT